MIKLGTTRREFGSIEDALGAFAPIGGRGSVAALATQEAVAALGALPGGDLRAPLPAAVRPDAGLEGGNLPLAALALLGQLSRAAMLAAAGVGSPGRG